MRVITWSIGMGHLGLGLPLTLSLMMVMVPHDT